MFFLLIVPGKGFIIQFMVYILNILIATFYVQITSFRICILCLKFSTVVVSLTFSYHNTNRSFQ